MLRKPERQSSRATLQEVATLARVSATTVSLVLAGKAGNRRISDDTHLRVNKAAEELNYAPNLLTRSLRQGRTNIISFFSSFRNREEDDLYMDKMVSAVESAGGQAGYDILVHCNFRRSPREIYQFLNGGIAEGLLLFAPTPDDPLLPLLRNSSLPVVFVNGRDPQGMFPSVADDHREGIRLIAEAIRKFGHKNVAILVPADVDYYDAKLRAELLAEQLTGLSLSVLAVQPNRNEFLSRLIAQPDAPTVVFCWHDRLAYEVLAAAEELGISVPNDLSVVGYDGIHWPSATSHVAASVKVDLSALARGAVSLLDQLITGHLTSPVEETQPVFFHRGTSLGFAPHLQRSNLT